MEKKIKRKKKVITTNATKSTCKTLIVEQSKSKGAFNTKVCLDLNEIFFKIKI